MLTFLELARQMDHIGDLGSYTGGRQYNHTRLIAATPSDPSVVLVCRYRRDPSARAPSTNQVYSVDSNYVSSIQPCLVLYLAESSYL